MSENNYPGLCFEVGLTCEDCTASSARELARACRGLRGKMVAQLFVQIYPSPACSRMLPAFVAAYKSAMVQPVEIAGPVEIAAPVESPVKPAEPLQKVDAPPKKGVQPETEPRHAAAAAA